MCVPLEKLLHDMHIVVFVVRPESITKSKQKILFIFFV